MRALRTGSCGRRLAAQVAVYVLVVFAGVVLPAGAEDTPDVTIEETIWGYDGKACRGCFVPLSVLVRNNSPTQFEGTLRLTKSLRIEKQIDAPVDREVYVGPMSSRWIQFFPLIIDEWEEYHLSWGASADEKFEVPTPRLGDPATVLLYDPGVLAVSGGALRRFNQDLFPAWVTATDCLRGVAMDAPPRWQAARRESFLDWLYRGGRVYLLHSEQGVYPRFETSLDILNRDQDDYRVGSGRVRRIPRTPGELDQEFVRNVILSDQDAGRYNSASWDQFRKSQGFDALAPRISESDWETDTELLRDLQEASRFERNWFVIYGLAILYLLVLFPGCYQIGREARDYRAFYVVFLLTAALFSYGFASLGRLGGATLSRARSVAIARQLSDGDYDVTQWTSVAAKVGGQYTIAHKGTGRLYSTGQEIEAVSGRIINGVEGRLEVDIPTGSTRTVIHRTKVEADPLDVTLLSISTEGSQLDQLSIGVGAGFPRDPAAILVSYQGEFYEMRRINDRLVLDLKSHKPGLAYLASRRDMGTGFYTAWTWRQSMDDGDRDPEQIFSSMLRPLLGYSFGLRTTIEPQALMLGSDIVRLMVYAELPQELQITEGSFPDQWGYVLYVVDLPTREGVQEGVPRP